MGFGKDGKGVIIKETRSQAVGTLANSTVLIIGTNIATVERFRMLKTQVMASITGVTAGNANGYYFGLADGDLSLTEIEQGIETIGPLGPNDIVTNAFAIRPIWILGGIKQQNNTEVLFENETGGSVLVGTPRWTFASIKSWNFFIYNMGAAPTTGSTVDIRVKSFGVWVT